MTEPSILDLVRYGGRDLVAVSNPSEGRILLVESDWPAEFSELDEYESPSPIEAPVAEIEVLELAADRFSDFNGKVITAGDNAEASGGWDWDEVNGLLLEAVVRMPRHYFDLAAEDEGGPAREQTGEQLAGLIGPAAAVIATHVSGSGEADVGDLAAALELARAQAAPRPTP